MYSSVYFHKTVRSAEVMAQSALERLPEYPEVPHAVFGMTDGDGRLSTNPIDLFYAGSTNSGA